jgi:hypothetical protein
LEHYLAAASGRLGAKASEKQCCAVEVAVQEMLAQPRNKKGQRESAGL